jgi:hypothetical protein
LPNSAGWFNKGKSNLNGNLRFGLAIFMAKTEVELYFMAHTVYAESMKELFFTRI